jgi:hypothetical protein
LSDHHSVLKFFVPSRGASQDQHLATSKLFAVVAAALPFASKIPQCGIIPVRVVLSAFCAIPASESAERLRVVLAEIVVALLPFRASARGLNVAALS